MSVLLTACLCFLTMAAGFCLGMLGVEILLSIKDRL